MTLKISNTLSLPLDFVTSTQAILAKKGSGKSYTASVQAEELLAAQQQIVVVDPTGAWFGLRTSADGTHAGYSIAVLGGEHGDVGLEPLAGEVIADAIAADHFSAIIDLSLFRKGEALRFMATFLETLYRKNRDPLHLFLDEADTCAPQKTFGPDESRVLGATEDIVRRGRRRGIGCTLITQRPQVLNKNVLSQVDMLTALRMNHPKDLGAIREWVAVHGDEAQAKRMLADLPSLPIGDAWVWAPATDILERVTIRRRTTFDSGRTPKAGEVVAAPRVLAPVDIARLGKTIAATVERVKENDPKALKARVAELEQQLAGGGASDAEVTALREQVKSLKLQAWAAKADCDRLVNVIESAKAALAVASAPIFKVANLPALASEPTRNPEKFAPKQTREEFAAALDRQASARPPAKQRLLDTLALLERLNIPRTRETVAAWYGQHPNSKGLVNNLGTLRSGNLVQGYELTAGGRAIARRAPVPTREEALATISAHLTPAQQTILGFVIGGGRGGIAREQLASAVGMHANSKGLVNNLGALRTRGLIGKGWPAVPGAALAGLAGGAS